MLGESTENRGEDLARRRNVPISFQRESQKRILAGPREAAPGKTESPRGGMRSGFRVLDLSEHVAGKAGEEPCGWR
jgi:hypothetical protein